MAQIGEKKQNKTRHFIWNRRSVGGRKGWGCQTLVFDSIQPLREWGSMQRPEPRAWSSGTLLDVRVGTALVYVFLLELGVIIIGEIVHV